MPDHGLPRGHLRSRTSPEDLQPRRVEHSNLHTARVHGKRRTSRNVFREMRPGWGDAIDDGKKDGHGLRANDHTKKAPKKRQHRRHACEQRERVRAYLGLWSPRWEIRR